MPGRLRLAAALEAEAARADPEAETAPQSGASRAKQLRTRYLRLHAMVHTLRVACGQAGGGGLDGRVRAGAGGAAMEERVARRTQRVRDLKAYLSELEGKLQGARAEAARGAGELRQGVTYLSVRTEDVRRKLRHVEQALEARRAQAADAQAAKAGPAAELEPRLRQAAQHEAALRSEVVAKRTALVRAEARAKAIADTRRQVLAELAQMQQRAGAVKGEVADIQRRIEEAQRRESGAQPQVSPEEEQLIRTAVQ